MPLMKVSQYRHKFFAEGSRPSINTVKRWIDDGEISGKMIGGLYFVEVSDSSPKNHLVSKVLRHDTTT